MKKKNTLILIVMLVFAGVALLGYSSALATLSSCPEGATDCVNLKYGTKDAYAIYYRGLQPEGYYAYEIGAVEGVSAKDTPGLAYLAFKLMNVFETDPGGAAQPIDQFTRDCTETVYSPWFPFKLNLGLNVNKKNYVIKFYPLPGTTVDEECGYIWGMIGTTCVGGEIPVLRVGFAPANPSVPYSCGDQWETLTFVPSKCGETDVQVWCNYETSSPTLAHEIQTPTAVAEAPDNIPNPDPKYYTTNNLANFGLDPVCALCTDKGVVAISGNQAWSCY